MASGGQNAVPCRTATCLGEAISPFHHRLRRSRGRNFASHFRGVDHGWGRHGYIRSTADRSVTLAGQPLEPNPVDKRDVTTVVSDHVLFLQFACDNRHGRSSDSQHLSKTILRERKVRVVHAIRRLEKPTGQPRFNRMEGLQAAVCWT
jgi:hypothetical protein